MKITGQELKEQALGLHTLANPHFQKDATEATVIVAHSKALKGEPFTVEDARNHYLQHYTGGEPRDARAWGAVMHKLAKLGLIEQTGHYTKSKNPAAHARPIPTWRLK